MWNKYSLDTLDNYDYERLAIDKTTKKESFHATYDNAMEAINGLREKLGGSTLFDNGLRQASSGAVIGLHVRTTSTLNSLNSLRRVLNESVKKESLTGRT